MTTETWPALPYESWRETATTLHLWTQIIGKVRLACTPWLNHSWHVTLYVTVRGLSTSPIPYGDRSFEFEFDFVEHRLLLTADGTTSAMSLRPMTVASFYDGVMQMLGARGITVQINPV